MIKVKTVPVFNIQHNIEQQKEGLVLNVKQLIFCIFTFSDILLLLRT